MLFTIMGILWGIATGSGVVSTRRAANAIADARETQRRATQGLVLAAAIGAVGGVITAYIVLGFVRESGLLDKDGIIGQAVDRIFDLAERLVLPLLDLLPGVSL